DRLYSRPPGGLRGEGHQLSAANQDPAAPGCPEVRDEACGHPGQPMGLVECSPPSHPGWPHHRDIGPPGGDVDDPPPTALEPVGEGPFEEGYEGRHAPPLEHSLT